MTNSHKEGGGGQKSIFVVTSLMNAFLSVRCRRSEGANILLDFEFPGMFMVRDMSIVNSDLIQSFMFISRARSFQQCRYR